MAQSPSRDAKFRGIFDAHFAEVQRYCVRRLSTADANDATSEVFLVAWRRFDSIPDGDETLPWLIGVARNVVRNVARSNRRSVRLASKVSDLPTETVPGPETQVVMGSQFEEVQEALERLSDDDRRSSSARPSLPDENWRTRGRLTAGTCQWGWTRGEI